MSTPDRNEHYFNKDLPSGSSSYYNYDLITVQHLLFFGYYKYLTLVVLNLYTNILHLLQSWHRSYAAFRKQFLDDILFHENNSDYLPLKITDITNMLKI
jgi:hypothetical protein